MRVSKRSRGSLSWTDGSADNRCVSLIRPPGFFLRQLNRPASFIKPGYWFTSCAPASSDTPARHIAVRIDGVDDVAGERKQRPWKSAKIRNRSAERQAAHGSDAHATTAASSTPCLPRHEGGPAEQDDGEAEEDGQRSDREACPSCLNARLRDRRPAPPGSPAIRARCPGA